MIGAAGLLRAEDPGAYLLWMEKNLPEVPAWTEWQHKTGELPPDFAVMKRSNLLPDPLRFYDGRKVTTAAEWRSRRDEIMQLFQKYVTGTLPPKPSVSNMELLDNKQEKGYVVKNVKITFGPEGKGSVRIRLVIPDAPKGTKMPVMISPSLSGWAQTVIPRGYISAGYAGNDWMDDAEPLKSLYPSYDFAALPRRAWLAQVVVDYLYTVEEVDTERIAINGYSRDGKMAMMAAAFDERIAAVLAGSTGVGGAVPWRFAGERGGGESLESTTRSFPTWFHPRLRFFSGREDYLPVDANLLLALVAPRAALLEWGYTDQVANGWAMEQAFHSAKKVYDLLGIDGKLGMLAVPGFHGSNDADASIDWLDEQFGCRKSSWVNRFIFPWNYDGWEADCGITAADAPENRLDAVRWMLGEAPVRYTPPADEVFRFPFALAGPTEPKANPGQLAPDVPAWVIAAGGGSYGWIAPEKENVASRRIRFNGVTGDLYYPRSVPQGKRLPLVVWLHGFHYPLGYMWVYRTDLHPVLALTRAGYAVLAYDQTGFGTRWNEAADFYARFPQWSRMGKMVDDLSNAIDALENDSLIDVRRGVALFGFSLGGAVGLYTAALDSRIAAVVSVCGFTPMRSDTPDKGLSGMTRYSHLYGLIPRLGLFKGKEQTLPYDFNDLLQMIMPRKALVVQPLRDRDADPDAVRKAVKSVPGTTLHEPDDYGRLTNSTQDKAIDWLINNFPL